MKMWNYLAYAVLTAMLVGCGSGKASLSSENGLKASMRSKSLTQSDGSEGSADNRCNATHPDREVSEYDTSGDDQADVRKVFMRVGAPPLYRLVMICREVDLNADGVKDLVRHYDDEGRPLREEADLDFDGRMDAVSFYQHGELLRKEIDSDKNGIIDHKVFYEGGKPIRSECDLIGSSTTNIWRANRWEYYEGGRVIRMGTDTDGDGRVDRWDRNEELSHAAKSEEEQEESEDEPDKASADK